MYYVAFDKFNASLLNKSIIIIIYFILLQISLSMNIEYLTDSSVTKVLFVSSWVKLSNFECTFRSFKNSWFDGYMNKVGTFLWFCDKLQEVVSLEAMILREPGRLTGNERGQGEWQRAHYYHSTTSVPDMEEMHSRKWDWNHHTHQHTQCPSLSVVPVHRQQKLSVFTWGTLGFHSSRCRGTVCALQSRIWNNLTAVFSQQSQKFKYIIHQNWTLWWDHM